MSDHRTTPLGKVYRAHHHAPNSSAHRRASPLSFFVSFVFFAVVISTAKKSARRERMTTAKDAKYAKVKETATIHLKRDPSLNPATECARRRETAIKEDVGKPTSRASIICPAHDVSAEIILHPTNVGHHRARPLCFPFVNAPCRAPVDGMVTRCDGSPKSPPRLRCRNWGINCIAKMRHANIGHAL